MNLESNERTACQERAGFLFRHACDTPAASRCDLCGKRICTAHTQRVERHRLGADAALPRLQGQQGPLDVCTGCAQRRRLEPARNSSYWDDDPYWYSRWHQPGYDRYGVPDSIASTHSPHSSHDPQDFTDADSGSVRGEGDAGREHDISGS